MKRGNAFFVTALIVFLLVFSSACSSTKTSSSNQKITLTFWEAQDQLPPGMKKSDWWLTKAINQYEKDHKNITVNVMQLQTGEAYDAKIKAAGVAQNGPDVATFFAGGQVLSNSKFLEPLDQYLSPDFIKSLSGWEAERENYDKNGKIYGVPFGTGYYYYVYYKKKLFEKAGIDPNAPAPKTWEDLLVYASKLKAAGITPFEIGEKDGWNGAWVIDSWLAGELGSQGVFDMYHKKIPMNDSAMVKSYQAWHDLYAKGYTNPDAPSMSSDKALQQFLSGNAAMVMMGMWVNPDVDKGLQNNAGIFPVPPLAGSKYPDSLSGGPNNAYVVFKSSKHKQEAVDFIKYLTSSKIQDTRVAQEQSESSNAVGSDPNMLKSPIAKQQAQEISKSKQTGYPWDNVMPQQLCDFWYRTNAQVFAGKLDPKEAANSLQQEYQQENP